MLQRKVSICMYIYIHASGSFSGQPAWLSCNLHRACKLDSLAPAVILDQWDMDKIGRNLSQNK